MTRPDQCPRCKKIGGNEVIGTRGNEEIWMCKGEEGCNFSWRVPIEADEEEPKQFIGQRP